MGRMILIVMIFSLLGIGCGKASNTDSSTPESAPAAPPQPTIATKSVHIYEGLGYTCAAYTTKIVCAGSNVDLGLNSQTAITLVEDSRGLGANFAFLVNGICFETVDGAYCIGQTDWIGADFPAGPSIGPWYVGMNQGPIPVAPQLTLPTTPSFYAENRTLAQTQAVSQIPASPAFAQTVTCVDSNGELTCPGLTLPEGAL